MTMPLRRSILTFCAFAGLGFAFGLFGMFRGVVRFTPMFKDLQMQFIEACRWGHVPTMQRLYEKGASPTAPAKSGSSQTAPPMIEAAELGNPEAVKWLLDHGATWDEFFSDGVTPLGAAQVKKRDAELTIEILKAHGAVPRD